MTNTNETFSIPEDLVGKTLAAVLRLHRPGDSWSDVRRLVETRRVRLNGEVCVDAARRLKPGDTIELLAKPDRPAQPKPPVVLRYVDPHVVVAEKPAGICTVRHPAERDWPDQRKALSPALDELVWKELAAQEKPHRPALPRLRIVHRLDKGTSGLVVFARTVPAERGLGKQFHAHTVHRRYLAVVAGEPKVGRIESLLIRDRGDGRRGSAPGAGQGKRAVTHLQVAERLGDYSLVSCRLETGRTHQIRIHLAEAGHPVCGDAVYHHLRGGEALPDLSGAPRLGLHAAELGFTHPVTGAELRFTMPLPHDLEEFLKGLRAKPGFPKRPKFS